MGNIRIRPATRYPVAIRVATVAKIVTMFPGARAARRSFHGVIATPIAKSRG
jgi:hypothetical protein